MAYFPLISLALLLAQVPSPLAETPLFDRLQRIEQHYNSVRTLKSSFEQTLSVAQGRRVTERGTLFLRKPGQMRWEYEQPAGKLFVSDGKIASFLSPASRRLEQSPIKETDDLRIPLAFLLGRLDFRRDFQRFEEFRRDTGTSIRAFPKNPKTPFEYIEFVATPDGRLSIVNVLSKDGSTMSYTFQNEIVNPPLAAGLFTVQAPEGYEVVRLKTAQ